MCFAILYTSSSLIVIFIYPNPASMFITLELPEEKSLYEINILDYAGKVIRNQLFKGGKQSMQIKDLVNGAYLIEIIAPTTDSVLKNPYY